MDRRIYSPEITRENRPLGMEGLYEQARNLKGFLENPKNKIPPTKFNFFFSAHDSLEDFDGLRGVIEDSDIFLSEREGWSDVQLKYYNLVSEGRASESPRAGYVMDLGLLNQLKGTKKPVSFVDVPYEHPLDLEFKRIISGLSYLDVTKNGYENALREAADLTRKMAAHTQAREEYMLGQIKTQMQGLFSKKPDLKKSSSLKVAFYAGAAHTPLQIAMSHEGMSSERKFHNGNFQLNSFEENVRALRMGTVADLDEAKSKMILFGFFLNEKLYARLKAKTPHTDKVDRYIRKIFSLFSTEEMEKILSQSSLVTSSAEFFKLLNEKGVDITKAGSELV